MSYVFPARLRALFIPLVLFLVSCGGQTEKSTAGNTGEITKEQRMADPRNRKAVDSAISLLREGDLVLRTGADVTSYMLCQMNQMDKTYSHCGLVLIEDGYPFVYHSIGGEDNPDERLRRDSASFWFSPANNLGLGVARFGFADGQKQQLAAVIRQFYTEKRKFDMKFDLATDDRLYCAEFVYKAINQAVADPGYLKPITMFGYSFMGIDNLFLNTHAHAVCQIRFK